MKKKVYDLMDDLLELETDVLMMYRQVLKEQDTQVKAGGKTQFGYRVRMTLTNIDVMNDESFITLTIHNIDVMNDESFIVFL